MATRVTIGDRAVGEGEPCYVIGEIGINHNGDIGIAKQLIDAARLAGCDAVKFQKRTPEICVPPDQRDKIRQTPWGEMTYLAYRHKVEFETDEYAEIDRHARQQGVQWFASPWDVPSIDFLEPFDPPCYKVASASITDREILERLKQTGRPIMISTGMSTLDEVDAAVEILGADRLLIAHATSTYPCAPHETNLRMIHTLKQRYAVPIGYSGHEVGLQMSLAAVALGATFIERHITLDRAMWGSDQAASVEPHGLFRLVRDIRIIEQGMGDGVKRVYDSELPIRAKLRRVAAGER